MLTVFDGRKVALINSEGRIVHSSAISVFDQVSFAFYIEFTSYRTIVLKDKEKNGKLPKLWKKRDQSEVNPNGDLQRYAGPVMHT